MSNLTNKLISLGYSENSPVFLATMDALISLTAHELTSAEKNIVLDLVSSFGFNEVDSSPLFYDDAWIDFDYGNVRIGDYIRVKDGAYDSLTGEAHNGRVGVLLNLSGRRASVRYLGIRSKSRMSHPIGNLQSLRK